MRRPSRQIEVFDISLMAVVTKAMGAFLVLFVLVLPFYTGDPNVQATAKAAREQIEHLKRELESLAARVGADPRDEQALRDAVKRMQAMVDEGNAQIDQLSRQANALSSQLRRASQERDAAKAEAAKNLKAYQQRVSNVASLEATANRYKSLYDADAASLAKLEMISNRMQNILTVSAFQTRMIVAYHWTWEPDCPKDGMELFYRRVPGEGADLPENFDLSDLTDKGAYFTSLTEAMNIPIALHGSVAEQASPRAFRIVPLWRGEYFRGLTVAMSRKPLVTACHFDLETTVANVHSGQVTSLVQRDLEIAASARYAVANGLDYSASSKRISAPTDDDMTVWLKMKSDVPQFCAKSKC